MDYLVFVVDRDTETRAHTTALVEEFAHVETASSTDDAVRRLEDGRLPDLIIIDADEIPVQPILQRCDCNLVVRASANTVSSLPTTVRTACYGFVQKTPESDAFLLATVKSALERARGDHEAGGDTEAYRFFFENLPVAAVVSDPNYVIQQWNRGAEELFGYTRDEAVGHELTSLLHSQKNELSAAELRDSLKNTLRENQKSSNTNYDRTKDGRDLLCAWFDLPYNRDDRAHILSVATDVTKEEELLAALKKTIEQKDFLMQEIYHRLKNNLNLIISLISLKVDEIEATEIEATDVGQAGEQAGEQVGEQAGGETSVTNRATSVESLKDITQKISAFSVLYDMLYEYGGGVQAVDVGRYREELLQTVFSSMAGHTCHVETDMAEVNVAPQTAIVLGLITNEIATNALKYGFRPDGERVFSVALRPDSTNGMCEYALSNTGNPFPEDVHLTDTSSLGLQLINSLVEQLNGTVELQKHPLTQYTIRFPIEASQPPDDS